jgi:alpha-galactosidase
MKQKASVRVADIDFVFSAETKNHIQPQINVEVIEDTGLTDTYLMRLTVDVPNQQPFVLCDLSVEWITPISDMHGLYFGGNPRAELSYLPFWETKKQTCTNTGVPYLSLIHKNGENRIAFGSFDHLTETSLKAELSELTRCYRFQFQKPANKDTAGQLISVSRCWEEVFFVSKAKQPWSEVLQHYVQSSDRVTRPEKMPVPASAYDPVFCSWTAIHHDVSHEWIMRNARIAADLGFRTWITDDGWFIEKGHFANYSRAGDWLPCVPKFPDFKAHVRMVQELGFRYVLWVSPFMVGKESEATQRYAHLLTTGQDHLGFKNLSPWHAETRQVIGNLLERLIRDYNLDGLKIDFLDSVSIHSVRNDGAGNETLGESLYNLLNEVVRHLLTINPDLLIEFRNPYANVASRSYANIYRSSDVPINFSLNRWQAVMLRILTPDRAIHMDPALWHPLETDENVAVHLINLIVTVPMVSIELDEYPQAHLDMIRYWISFYNTHRDTIIHGEFKPVLRQGYIPQITFVGKNETIIGLYEDVPVSLGGLAHTTWILNASTRDQLEVVSPDFNRQCTVITRDKFGMAVAETQINFPLTKLSVEVGGSLEIR